MTSTKDMTRDEQRLYSAALELGRRFDTHPITGRGDFNGYIIPVKGEGREIRIAAIDGEWGAGVIVMILNRHGVLTADAVVRLAGLSPGFVADLASSLEGEITAANELDANRTRWDAEWLAELDDAS